MKFSTILLFAASILVILGCGINILSHPFDSRDVVTLSGMIMLSTALLAWTYLEITNMRTDEQGRRYYYSVWGWFEEKVLHRPYDENEPLKN